MMVKIHAVSPYHNMQINISVCIPVYGVEKYIEKCARSLFEQTITEGVEFIFVDDCTPDKSIEILQEVLAQYPNRENQVRILHHDSNQGLPAARATGIKAASGKYIMHVDSDDYVESNACERLIEEAERNQADIIVADYYKNYPDGRIETVTETVNTDNFVTDMLTFRNSWSVWNKLIRRDLYYSPKPIKFARNYMCEDLVIIFQLVMRAKNIQHVPEAFYHYYQNPKSAVKNQDKDTLYRHYQGVAKNFTIIRETAAGSSYDNVEFLNYLKMCEKTALFALLRFRGYHSLYMSTHRDINWPILLNRYTPARTKFKHLAAMAGLFRLWR